MPLFFASAILPDGRVIIEGGEYNYADQSNTQDFTTLGAIYDPVFNSWTAVSPPAGFVTIGDAPSVVLPNGTFLIGFDSGRLVAKLNASNLTWTVSATNKADTFAEEGLILLPSGQVLALDTVVVFGSELYSSSTNSWASGGSTQAQLSGGQNHCYEIGPALLRPDGSVFAIGQTGNSAIRNSSGTWSIGPTIPFGLAPDGPAAILPNGNVLFNAALPDWPSCATQFNSTQYFEFDGTAINPAPSPTNVEHSISYNTFMLVLPTGQILLTDMSSYSASPHIYTAAGTYQDAWRPAVTSVAASLVRGSVNNPLVGEQLNGMTQAAAFGDDAQTATNFPLVRVVNSHSLRVVYARTHAFSSMGVATGTTSVSTQFDIPKNTQAGPSTLFVVANGIPSAPIVVNVSCKADGIFCDGYDF